MKTSSGGGVVPADTVAEIVLCSHWWKTTAAQHMHMCSLAPSHFAPDHLCDCGEATPSEADSPVVTGLSVLDFKEVTSVSEDFISRVEKLGGTPDLISALRLAGA